MYKKLTHREHVLQRPESYAGSIEPETVEYWDPDTGEKTETVVSPISLKIFDEILVNAIDERQRTGSVDQIEVFEKDGTFLIASNKSIPFDAIEMIFGNLLTSSNFDDDKERYTGGKNGLGSKLTNIFSKMFKVTSRTKTEEYTQVWRENMSICEPAIIKPKKSKSEVLIVEFTPDYSRLGEIPTTQIFKRRTLEASLWVPHVSWNGVFFPSNETFQDFAKKHTTQEILYYSPSKYWEICIARSTDSFQQISFVNGICTSKGGTHIDMILQKLAFPGFKKSQISSCLFVFAKCTIDRPTFSSQTKTESTSKNVTNFEFPPAFLKKVFKMIEDDLKMIELSKVKKKTDGKKIIRVSGIPKLDDANHAGSKKAKDCTLILTEGDSAKALAIAGLSVIGRDFYGVFPLRGKPTNVRDVTMKQIEANAEFTNIKKICGLKMGQVYTDVSSLRYGRIMIMTDADVDGSHITGLLINMFHYFWPSLIQLGYLTSMVTPVIKADSKWFYTEDEFRASDQKYKNVKYYKGLGTSTSAEAREYFKMISKLTVSFGNDEKMDDSVTLGFSKKRVADRKEWLKQYMALSDKPEIPYGHISKLSISDFIHKDLIKFSVEDIKRSIPHICDGLKPSQRKVIFAALKRNLVKDLSLVKFGGYVAEVSDYHHGEASLHGTIIGLAQDFVGSNNLNLLMPMGQFGTRIQGGHDSASPRYISTRLSPETKPLFAWSQTQTEPDYYIPILPIILINGSKGIGTGFSCSIPPFNPADIRKNIERLLAHEPMVKMTPWYRGFKGTVEQNSESSWTFKGIYKNNRVTELPPGLWIQDFKETLEKLVDTGVIHGYVNNSTETEPNFLIEGEIDSSLLEKTVRTSNMYLNTPAGLLKFENAEEILVYFSKQRLMRYKDIKKAKIEALEKEVELLDEKKRFISLVVSDALVVFKRPRVDIVKDLTENNLSEDMLNTKTYEYTTEKIQELMDLIEKKKQEIDTARTTTIAQMWQNDIRSVYQG